MLRLPGTVLKFIYTKTLLFVALSCARARHPLVRHKPVPCVYDLLNCVIHYSTISVEKW